MHRFPNLMGRSVPLYMVFVVMLFFGGLLVLGVSSVRNQMLYQALNLPESADHFGGLQYGSIPALARPDFFRETKESFIRDKATFIEANLSSMQLRYYTDGVLRAEYPILTKGREGSWWETPAGLYRIQAKEENHFSAFAKVHLPWSLPFEGNFFIHGWPYYPGGKPVASQYSGGCIRLSTDDAGKLYSQVAVGTPVLVFEEDFTPETPPFVSQVPDVRAEGYLAADVKSSYVFAEKQSRVLFPIASLTKLMTALVAVEYVNIEQTITVDQTMIVPTSRARLEVGTAYSLYDLLHPLLLESSNEAGEAIAALVGRTRFIALMNEKAKAIGMIHTTFTDPSGRDAGNVSTAEDLFALAKYLMNNRSFILRLTAGETDTRAYGDPAFTDLGNFNLFATDPRFIGGKVGTSDAAKEAALVLMNLPFGGAERPVLFVVLRSPDRGLDGSALIRFVTTAYTTSYSSSSLPTTP
jgi:D-alanyl-D-alanine carboxypeptidase